ncbi:PREDICTED: chemocyanin-like [Lupinus angustifolius]|uniref:chemocyanin-like n=1 Tax=Lupinus angustifolius TaxID=3871 RepID=UPI00092F49E8|nr:PREDICTED: chemocyanin-like [Lupinus angustifolius]
MGDGKSNRAMMAIMLLCCMLVFQFEIAHAKIYTVGDAAGWSFYVRNWPYVPVDKHFVNGDQFVFKFDPKLGSVVKVNQEDYNSCNPNNPIVVFRSGTDTITLQTGAHFFISGNIDNCQRRGMSMALQLS